MCVCVSVFVYICLFVSLYIQRLWKLTQSTADWLPADAAARQTLQQQRLTSLTMTSHVDAMTSPPPVGLVGYRSRLSTDDVTYYAPKDGGGFVNVAYDDQRY